MMIQAVIEKKKILGSVKDLDGKMGAIYMRTTGFREILFPYVLVPLSLVPLIK